MSNHLTGVPIDLKGETTRKSNVVQTSIRIGAKVSVMKTVRRRISGNRYTRSAGRVETNSAVNGVIEPRSPGGGGRIKYFCDRPESDALGIGKARASSAAWRPNRRRTIRDNNIVEKFRRARIVHMLRD